MKTVFLILNYQTYTDTIELVNELLSQEIGNRKIVIVDNCSPNGSYGHLQQEFANSIYVDVIQSGYNGGYAKGNNFGLLYIEKYAPEFVCIINNDVHFSLATIKKMEDMYANLDNVGIISPTQYLIHEDLEFHAFYVHFYNQDHDQHLLLNLKIALILLHSKVC